MHCCDGEGRVDMGAGLPLTPAAEAGANSLCAAIQLIVIQTQSTKDEGKSSGCDSNFTLCLALCTARPLPSLLPSPPPFPLIALTRTFVF